MATFSVVKDRNDNYGGPKDRVKTRKAANALLEAIASTGEFVWIVRWHEGEPKEMDRRNDNPTE